MPREVASKVLDGINDLVIMAPIREGLINAYEPVTYATRLRIISEALNDIRAAAREYEKDSPFADASERILSLLEFKAGIIDNDLLQLDPALGLKPRRYLYLIATFDGVWEPYMRLIWQPLGSLLDLLFSNCEGYVWAVDNSFEDYINWVRSAQVDSAVFFTTTGVTVSDQLYLRDLERIQREQNAESGDLAITRRSLANPGVTAATVRQKAPLMADKLALEALGVFYRLADYYPPLSADVLRQSGEGEKGEGHLLQRAVHRILEGWDGDGRHALLNAPEEVLTPEQLKLRGALMRFKPLLDWFVSGKHDPAFAPRALIAVDRPLDPQNIQHGILTKPGGPGQRIRHGALMLMSITCHHAAARLLRGWLDAGIISFGDQADGDGFSRTIGLTRTGLERLGLDRPVVDAFPKEFREGLHVRAPHLGDVWDNHPRNWRLPERNWPPMREGELARPPVEMEEVDLVLVLRHVSAREENDGGAAVSAELARLAGEAERCGVVLRACQTMQNHYGEDGRFRDHFGLRDGISQPVARADAEPDLEKRIGAARDHVRMGELLCGRANDRQDGDCPDEEDAVSTTPNAGLAAKRAQRAAARALQQDGTYLVIRKMRQDVAAFQAFKAANARKMGGNGDALIGKLLGRNPDGTPLHDPAAQDPNDFDFSQDAQGRICPFTSHIRRANPRATQHERPSPRLLRVGMSYGPAYNEATSDAERGLIFMAYNASISEQYETIQRWLNGGNSTGVSSANNCPITGTPPRPDGKRTYRFEDDGRVVRVEIDKPLTMLDWGLYLFVPTRAALTSLCSGERAWSELAPANVARGEAFIERLESLPEDLQAAEWQRVLEDFDAKDFSQRELTPDIYEAIRTKRGGALRVPGGIGPRDQKERPPAVLASGKPAVMAVLRDWKHYSVEEELARLTETSGSIYVAQQPDNQYDNPKLAEHSNYCDESRGTNAIINALTEEQGYADGYAAGQAVLDSLIADAEARHAGLQGKGKPEFKMELRREYLAPALARANAAWFGLPDGGFKEDGPDARFMKPGDWDWQPAGDRLPLCPGDCLSPSRHAFYPNSNKVSAALAREHGKAIGKAGQDFANYYFKEAGIASVPGRVSNPMFALEGMTPDLAARNVIGIMLGATPPTLGNLQGVFYDWLNERTLWRHQAALIRAAGTTPASYAEAREALREPLAASMCKRPSPELLFRTVRTDRGGATVSLDRSEGCPALELVDDDRVYLPLASATQACLREAAHNPDALEEGVDVIFGGNRDKADPPVHACPGRKLAMGAMMGIIAALLQVGRIQAQPAGLIIRVSDWQ